MVLDAVEQRGRRRRSQDLLLDHEPQIARDLAPRIGERVPRVARPLLEIDELHVPAAEREGEGDLAPDAPGPQHGHRVHHAGERP